jgi:hypothetical protein
LKTPEAFMERWKEWHDPLADARLKLIRALRARDEEAAVEAMDVYLNDQLRLFGSFVELAEIRISDPAVVRSVADSGVVVPAYRDLHAENSRLLDRSAGAVA